MHSLLLVPLLAALTAGSPLTSPSPSASPSSSSPAGLNGFYNCMAKIMKVSPLPALFLPSGSALPVSSPNIYAIVRTGERARIDRWPHAVYQAQSEQDILNAVSCAHSASLPMVPRGGGHSYEDFSSQNNSLVIDTAGNNQISLLSSNSTQGIVTVGAGTRLGNLYTKLNSLGGFTFNGGTCPSVGIGGHVGGGGYGMLARLYGLAADQVREMRVVLYNGTLVTASPSEHPDLFWALRGGNAGSFGIVTQYTLNVYKAPVITMVGIQYNPSAFPQLILKWMESFPTIDSRLSCQLQFSKAALSLNAQFTGPQSDLEAVLRDSGVLNVTGIIAHQFASCDVLGAKAFIATGSCNTAITVPTYLLPTDKDYGKYKADFGSVPLPPAGATVIANIMSNAPSSGWIQFEALGGAVGAKEVSDTPYYNRKSLFSMQYAVGLAKGEQKTSYNWKWIYSLESALKPFVNGHHYQNYPDLEIGPNYGVAYYGAENFNRLQQIKNVYDPNNVFRNEQSIPLPSQ